MALALAALLVLGQEAEVTAPPVQADPGWSRTAGGAGIALAAVPLGLSVASVVAMWMGYRNAQDWFTVGSGVSAPLVALVPTFGGRSAVLSDEAARKPRVFRIIGWVVTIYGAVSTLGGFLVGKVVGWLSDRLELSQYTAGDAGRVISTFTTLINGLICTAGVVLLSSGSLSAANAAVVPTVAVTPLPGGGGVMVLGGVSGRL